MADLSFWGRTQLRGCVGVPPVESEGCWEGFGGLTALYQHWLYPGAQRVSC